MDTNKMWSGKAALSSFVSIRVHSWFILYLFLLPISVQAGGHVKGVSLAHAMRGGGYGSDACCAELKKIADLGGNWVSISDFAFMQSVTQPSVLSLCLPQIGRSAVALARRGSPKNDGLKGAGRE